ncbi:DUF6350 family protein [Nocardia sp. 004]|uniref:cell division protein PerM n=1 Tax=Nocardia sp. 004 TaxID=3385978 RepID=UPI00399F753E
MSSPRNALARRTDGARAPQPHPHEVSFLSLSPERARVLVSVASRPALFGLTAIIVLAFGTLLTSGGDLENASGVIAAGWLGTHQVPLVIGSTRLGLLPLLPTVLLVWLAGRECARAVPPHHTRADLGWILGAAIGGPLVVTSICLAVIADASAALALRPPNTLAAFAWVVGLYALAAIGGIASRTRGQLFVLLRLPDWAISGLYGASRSVLRLLGCAAVVALVSLLAHGARVIDTYQSAGDAVDVLGLTLLSLVYLPNLVVHAVGVLVGSSAHIGDASFGVFAVIDGPIPAVPLLAAAPVGPAAGWWPVLLVLPAAVGVLGGLDCARTSTDRITAPLATVTSAASAALMLAVAGSIAGGELGTFGRVGLEPPIFALITFGWLAISGCVGLAFARWFLVPVGSLPASYRDPYGEYGTDADQRYTGYYAEDEYEYHDGQLNPDYGDYRGRELDAEFVDEPAVIGIGSGYDATPDIVDAEVVEADLPDSDRMDGR